MIKTVSLETAKLLKEAGFRQDTFACWFEPYQPKSYCIIRTKELSNYISCPTTDELLEELPFTMDGNKLRICRFANGTFEVWYPVKKPSINDSLPEALASMYLFLKKEKLI